MRKQIKEAFIVNDTLKEKTFSILDKLIESEIDYVSISNNRVTISYGRNIPFSLMITIDNDDTVFILRVNGKNMYSIQAQNHLLSFLEKETKDFYDSCGDTE